MRRVFCSICLLCLAHVKPVLLLQFHGTMRCMSAWRQGFVVSIYEDVLLASTGCGEPVHGTQRCGVHSALCRAACVEVDRVQHTPDPGRDPAGSYEEHYRVSRLHWYIPWAPTVTEMYAIV